MRDVEAQLIHDMRNTAMVLREAAAELHENRESLPDVAVEHLFAMLERRSDMLVRLLGDLSTSHLAGRGGLDLALQAVSLAEIGDELLTARRPEVGKKFTVDLADDALVVADPLRITQVLDNLVTNALRYGGPHVSVNAVRDDTLVRLTVSDDGEGVPAELVGDLFNSYVHGADSHRLGGSGLGMVIVRQLCDAMAGSIEYDGSDGACFTATFPALPVTTAERGRDVADAGHSVTFWTDEDDLAETLLDFAVNGLATGEAVLVAATPAHHKTLEEGLTAIGIDPRAVIDSGQYLPLDADAFHADLPRVDHIDRERFETLIGETVHRVSGRWRSFRVFGEIVDLYWRGNDDHLALELEECWSDLRSRVPFPLLCGYELAPGESAAAICGSHDSVVA